MIIIVDYPKLKQFLLLRTDNAHEQISEYF